MLISLREVKGTIGTYMSKDLYDIIDNVIKVKRHL